MQTMVSRSKCRRGGKSHGKVNTRPLLLVRAAREVEDVFEKYGLPRQLPGTSLGEIQLTLHTGSIDQDSLSNWMLSCVEELRPEYEQSEMGWDSKRKLREMRHAHQRIIVAHRSGNHSCHKQSTLGNDVFKCDHGNGNKIDKSNGKVCESKDDRIAFLSYRWLIDEGRPALYVYEVYVIPQARGQGLAVALMHFAERLCIAAHIPLILLTAFDSNIPALALYQRKLGYVFLLHMSSGNYQPMNFFEHPIRVS